MQSNIHDFTNAELLNFPEAKSQQSPNLKHSELHHKDTIESPMESNISGPKYTI